MFIDPSRLWNALPTRFQNRRPPLSTTLYAAQGLRPALLLPLPSFVCWFSMSPPHGARAGASARRQSTLHASQAPLAGRPMGAGMGLRKWTSGLVSVRHAEGRRNRPRDVDLPELRLVLGDVVLQRVKEPLHVLGAVDHPRPHHGLRDLRLHVDEVDLELGLVVVHHRHVHVHALRGLLVDLQLDLDRGRSGWSFCGHARLLAPGQVARKRCGAVAKLLLPRVAWPDPRTRSRWVMDPTRASCSTA